MGITISSLATIILANVEYSTLYLMANQGPQVPLLSAPWPNLKTPALVEDWT